MKRLLLTTCLLLSFSITFKVLGQVEKLPENNVEVILFLAPDCPISQKYIKTVKEFYDAYKDSVKIKSYAPAQYSDEDLRTFEVEYDLPFKLLKDEENSMCKLLGARVTPEVFVLNNQKVLYHGAIDNWFYALGKSRLKVTEYYLYDAIEAILNGKTPKIKNTEAVGCHISY